MSEFSFKAIIVWEGHEGDAMVWVGELCGEDARNATRLHRKYFNCSDGIDDLYDWAFDDEDSLRFASYGLREINGAEPTNVSGRLILTGIVP